jgi:predicted RNA binding protein YcfA (HicA-like mRNA interferase family)
MPPLPTLSGKQVVRLLEKAGWEKVRQRGSHMILVKPEEMASLSVPNHNEVAKGTLRSLIRAAGLTSEGFLALRKK